MHDDDTFDEDRYFAALACGCSASDLRALAASPDVNALLALTMNELARSDSIEEMPPASCCSMMTILRSPSPRSSVRPRARCLCAAPALLRRRLPLGRRALSWRWSWIWSGRARDVPAPCRLRPRPQVRVPNRGQFCRMGLPCPITSSRRVARFACALRRRVHGASAPDVCRHCALTEFLV